MEVQSIQYSQFTVDDFSGGITDQYIGASSNKYRVGDNLVLEKYGDKARFRMRAGMEPFDSANPHISSGDSVLSLKYFQGHLLVWAKDQIYYQNTASTWIRLLSPNSAGPVTFSSSTAGSGFSFISEWQEHLLCAISPDIYANVGPPVKIYPNSANILQLRIAGLPDFAVENLANAPVITPNSAGVNSFLYRFCYKQTYTVGTVQYIDRGSLQEVSVATAGAPSTASPAAITNLHTSLTYQSWIDTTTLKIEVYRTVAGGINFFLAKTLSFGTTSSTDTMTDATLLTQEPLYTEGGVVENDPPPPSRVAHICADTGIAYYGDFYNGVFPSPGDLKGVVRQSIPGDFDSCPADFTVSISDQVMGLSSMQDRPVILGSENTYRIDGAFDLLGRGGMIAQKISDRADCVSGQSVVQTLAGVFWCGTDHFYWTNGYQVLPINLEWKKTHQAFTAALTRKIQGKYDRANNRVWWTVVSDGSSSNDKCYILDLNFSDPASNRWCFTSASYTGGTCPTAFEFVGSIMYSGDATGNIFSHDETLHSDRRILSGTDQTRAIQYTYESAAFDMGVDSVRKISPRMVVTLRSDLDPTGDNTVTPWAIGLTSLNDQSSSRDGLDIGVMKPILNGIGFPAFTGIRQNKYGLISEQRRFPSDSWRFTTKQIRLETPFVIISNSDHEGPAQVSHSAQSVHLTAGSFASDAIGYQIYFSSNDFAAGYQVISVNSNSDTIQVSDTASTFSTVSTASTTWLLQGYPLDTVFNLVKYTIDWAPLGKTQRVYQSAEEGALS